MTEKNNYWDWQELKGEEIIYPNVYIQLQTLGYYLILAECLPQTFIYLRIC